MKRKILLLLSILLIFLNSGLTQEVKGSRFQFLIGVGYGHSIKNAPAFDYNLSTECNEINASIIHLGNSSVKLFSEMKLRFRPDRKHSLVNAVGLGFVISEKKYDVKGMIINKCFDNSFYNGPSNHFQLKTIDFGLVVSYFIGSNSIFDKITLEQGIALSPSYFCLNTTMSKDDVGKYGSTVLSSLYNFNLDYQLSFYWGGDDNSKMGLRFNIPLYGTNNSTFLVESIKIKAFEPIISFIYKP